MSKGKKTFLKPMITVMIIGLFLFSTAYAMFNQLFTISGSATILSHVNCPTGLTYKYEALNSWGDPNSGYNHQYKLTIINNTSSNINTWSITVKGPSDLTMGNINAEFTKRNNEITITPTGNYTWAANINRGQSRDIDLVFRTAESTLNLQYLYFDQCLIVTGGNYSPLIDFVVDPSSISLKIGQAATIKTYKMPADARAYFSFQSANPSVATVSSSGVVTGVAQGNTTITVSATGISKTVNVTVSREQVILTGISLSPKQSTMHVGDVSTLVVNKTPADAGANVTFTSSNTSVATVNSEGRVTAVGAGTTTITARAGNLSDTASITVIRDAVAEDLDIAFSYQYYDSRNIQFIFNITNIGHSEIHSISFKVSFPSGTSWSYWNNYPAMFQASNNGTTITSTNSSLVLNRGNYINFTGNVMLPSGYNSSNYLNPTIYDVEVH